MGALPAAHDPCHKHTPMHKTNNYGRTQGQAPRRGAGHEWERGPMPLSRFPNGPRSWGTRNNILFFRILCLSTIYEVQLFVQFDYFAASRATLPVTFHNSTF